MNNCLAVIVGLIISAGAFGMALAGLLVVTGLNQNGAVLALVSGGFGVVLFCTGLICAFILHRK